MTLSTVRVTPAAAQVPPLLRLHGTSGRPVVLLHGGPGVPGTVLSLARLLGTRFQVYEPFQRRSDESDLAPLTVARHVADLHRLVRQLAAEDEPPALVGSAWGALLALAYAAEHPGAVDRVVVVGCPPVDARTRGAMAWNESVRTTGALNARLNRVAASVGGADGRMRRRLELMESLHGYDLIARPHRGAAWYDARGHAEASADVVRLQDDGRYPAAFHAIACPVLMLHGAADPSPGREIRARLAPHVRRLAYMEWQRCGRWPWLERYARASFLEVLGRWLDGDVRGEVSD